MDTRATTDEIAHRLAQIARWFRAGLSDREMADSLGVSERTIAQYRSRAGLYRKRGVPEGYQRGPQDMAQFLFVQKRIRQGGTYAGIAEELGISTQAVHQYVQYWGIR